MVVAPSCRAIGMWMARYHSGALFLCVARVGPQPGLRVCQLPLGLRRWVLRPRLALAALARRPGGGRPERLDRRGAGPGGEPGAVEHEAPPPYHEPRLLALRRAGRHGSHRRPRAAAGAASAAGPAARRSGRGGRPVRERLGTSAQARGAASVRRHGYKSGSFRRSRCYVLFYIVFYAMKRGRFFGCIFLAMRWKNEKRCIWGGGSP